MGNRIIKQSICTSESIDKLDWFEEVFYYRLIVNVDDYGVFDARPKILKASMFPLRDVKLSQIKKAVASLSEKGLIHLYQVEGKPFLNLPTWSEHQRLRKSKHRFPSPDQADLPQSAASCGELRRVAASCGENPQSAESCGLTRAREESESEYELESEYESELYCTELPDGNTAHSEPATDPEADVEALVLNDNSEWRPLAADFASWQTVYPNVDIRREFTRMRQWCLSNPSRRKTKRGIRRFVTSWLDKEQNNAWNGRTSQRYARGPSGADLYMQYAMEAEREMQGNDAG